MLNQTSLTNHGTIAQVSGSALLWTGGTTVAVTNSASGLWTFDAGSFGFFANGAGTLSFSNAGTMQGAGSASTTLTISPEIAYSNTGTVVAMTIVH